MLSGMISSSDVSSSRGGCFSRRASAGRTLRRMQSSSRIVSCCSGFIEKSFGHSLARLGKTASARTIIEVWTVFLGRRLTMIEYELAFSSWLPASKASKLFSSTAARIRRAKRGGVVPRQRGRKSSRMKSYVDLRLGPYSSTHLVRMHGRDNSALSLLRMGWQQKWTKEIVGKTSRSGRVSQSGFRLRMASQRALLHLLTEPLDRKGRLSRKLGNFVAMESARSVETPARPRP